MTGNFPPKRRGLSTFICDSCNYSEFTTYCVLRVPEYEGYKLALPCDCPFRMGLKTNWRRWME